MFKILNELVEIPINDRFFPADKRTRGEHNQAILELTPHWDNLFLASNYPSLEFSSGSRVNSQFWKLVWSSLKCF